jgi:hypothetical protein
MIIKQGSLFSNSDVRQKAAAEKSEMMIIKAN